MKNNNLILVNQDIIDSLEDMDLAVYIYICCIARTNSLPIHFTKHTIADYMKIKKLHIIDKSLKRLCEQEYIKQDNYSYMMEKYEADFANYYYTNIKLSDIDTLITNNKVYLLKHLLYIYASRDSKIVVDNKKYIIGHMPESYFAEKENTNETTISRHNKMLEELKLVYIHHTSYTNGNNLYSSYEDMEYVIKYAKEHTIKPRATRKAEGNHKRSLMQKYQWAMRGKVYDKDTIDEINAYIAEKNLDIQPLVYRQVD